MKYQPDVCPVCRFVFVDNEILAICPSCRANLSQLWLIVEEAESLIETAQREFISNNYSSAINLASKAKELAPQIATQANEIIIKSYFELKDIKNGLDFLCKLPNTDPLVLEYKPKFDELLVKENRAKKFYNAGLAFARNNRLIAARNQLLEATMIAPWLIKPHLTLCKVLILLKQYELAQQELVYLQDLNPAISELDILNQIISNKTECVNALAPEILEDRYIQLLQKDYQKFIKS